MKYLIFMGADISTNNHFAIRLAVDYGKLKVVEYLNSIFDNNSKIIINYTSKIIKS